jgi:hypothetical protein
VYWVSFRCEFQCRACGNLSPLNYLDLDGSVRCLRCGLDQAFATSAWQRALEHAHAVGDLAGSPEGRQPHPIFSIASENPYRDTNTATDQQSGFAFQQGLQVPTTMRSTATLGQPSCTKCNVPLQAQRTGPGRIETRCTRCGEARSYALPAEASRVFPALVGVIAGEQRVDRPATRVASEVGDSGAVALSCPGCGASLSVAPGTRLATCEYCRTTSRVPDKTYYRAGGDAVQAETWWLAFDGPSATRKKLERDPNFPREAGDIGSDLQADKPPRRKRPGPGELALIVGLPLLFVLAAAVVDLVLLGGLELDLLR